ncbi:MAG: MFS transporter [Gammaproteobacteria bacterium]|nr:MFS transporter [Gammaproteobacteria bacterium]
MVPNLMRDFGVDAAELGNIAAFYFYAYALFQLPAGALADKYGPSRPMTIAAILCVGGSLLFANAHHVWVAELSRLLIGCGSGFAFVCTLRLVANWFPSNRFALLVGLTNAFGMLGAFIGEEPVAQLVSRFGWRGAVEVISVIGIIIGLLIIFIIKDFPPKLKKARVNKSSISIPLLMQVIKEPQTWFNGLFAGAMNFPLATFGALWGMSYMERVYHLSPSIAATDSSMLFLGAIPGSFFFGWFSDYIGKRKMPMIAGGFFGLISILILLIYPGNSAIFAGILLFCVGFASGSIVMNYASAKEGHTPAVSGAAMGLVNTLLIAMCAISQPLFGWLLQQNWSGKIKHGIPFYSSADFRFAIWVIPIVIAIGIIISFFIKETCAIKN